MRPGPDRVLACPDCGRAVRLNTQLSGNTFGGVIWTDAKADYPMLPMTPEITRYQDCDRFFWLADATELGVLDWETDGEDATKVEWRSARRVEELSESEYLKALSSGVARAEDEEVRLRLHAWWRRNNALREIQEENLKLTRGAARPLSEAARSNLESLLELLGSDPPDQILMKAEILRELERYEEAAETLEVELPNELSGPSKFIRQLIEHRNARVQRLSAASFK